MQHVNTHDAKTRLSALLARVEQTREEITICRNGKPVARLVPIDKKPTSPLRKNPRLGPIAFHEDPCAPIDERAWPEECR